MLIAILCSNPGDSGSAVYFDGGAFDGKVKGIGILSGAAGLCGDVGWFTLVSLLDHIYDVMPVRAITRP